jgi:hypothetical protein
VQTFGSKSDQAGEIRQIIVEFVDKYIPPEDDDKGPIPDFAQLSIQWEQHLAAQNQDPNQMDITKT